MKMCWGVVILALLALPPMVRAEGPDDQYVGIYNLIQQADALNENGQAASAMAKYTEAQTALNQFRSVYPNWNAKVVNFRLNYLASKMAALAPKLPNAVAATNTVAPPAPPANPPANVPVTPPPAVAVEAPVNSADDVIRGLQGEITRLAGDKALLEAKLKEALAARPAAADPRELGRSQQQVRELQKENELLKVSLERSDKNRVLRDVAALELSQKAISEANQKLAAENQRLLAQVKEGVVQDPRNSALREENEILKKQVADLKGHTGAALVAGDLGLKLLAAQSQVAALESDKEMLHLEKTALENRIKQLAAAPPMPAAVMPAAVVVPAVTDTAGAEKIRQLEAQRDDLQKKLDDALKQLAANNKGGNTARLDEMGQQMAGLRARLDILEARRIPYTQEELAMLSKPEETTLVASVHRSSGKKSPKDLPARAAVLLAEARVHVGAHELELAESNYLEIVKLDGKNVAALDDLASIQVDLNHVADAEKNAAAALAIETNNDYSLFVMGRVKFQEGRYDDALDEFSRAAQINPQNAELQNYLGITLSEKGLRDPAEAALRKAVQIDPGYASAHANLAFIYATQQPPLLELARWHYEKAIAAGHPHNPELEKKLEPIRASGSAQ